MKSQKIKITSVRGEAFKEIQHSVLFFPVWSNIRIKVQFISGVWRALYPGPTR